MDVAVVTGGHDQMCAALGDGALSRRAKRPTQTGDRRMHHGRFREAKIHCRTHGGQSLHVRTPPCRGMYGTVAFCLTGGNILQWYRDQFGTAQRTEAERTSVNVYELLLKQIPEEPTPLLVLPYFHAPAARPISTCIRPALFFGLRLSTTRNEILRALLEGVAYEMRVNTEILASSGVAIREFFATGDGARNARWNQLKADVLGIPIHTIATTESGWLLWRCPAWGLPQNRAFPVPTTRGRVGPAPKRYSSRTPGRHAYYSEQFQKYRQLYQAVRKLA